MERYEPFAAVLLPQTRRSEALYPRRGRAVHIAANAFKLHIAARTRIGHSLFEREGRKIKLTKYGEEFYQYATEAVNALEKGIALAHEHAGSPTGSIDIGAIYTIQSDYLPSLIKGYRDQYGDAQVNVFQGLTQPLLEDLESNRYELAFTAYVGNKPDLTFVPVLTQRLVAVVHRSDKLAWSKNLTLDSLRGRDIITYPPTTPIGAEVSALMATHGLSATRAYANDEITLGSMVEARREPSASPSIPLGSLRSASSSPNGCRKSTTTSTRYASPSKPPHIKHAPLRTSSNSPDLSNGTTNGNRWLKNQRPPYNTRRHERNPIGPSSTRAATRTVHKKPSRQSQAMPRQLTARILSVENPYSWLFFEQWEITHRIHSKKGRTLFELHPKSTVNPYSWTDNVLLLL